MTATRVTLAPDPDAQRIYQDLAARDDGLARLIARHGQPDPFSWSVLDAAVGGDPFAELAFHIVSQQISTRAALTIYDRLRALLGAGIDPARIIATPVGELRSIGLSGARARSLLDLASRVNDGSLSLPRSLEMTMPRRRSSSQPSAASGRGRRRCSCCTTSAVLTSFHRRTSACSAQLSPRSRYPTDPPQLSSKHARSDGGRSVPTQPRSYGRTDRARRQRDDSADRGRHPINRR